MAVGSGGSFNRQSRADLEHQSQSEFGFARGPIRRSERVDPRRARHRAGRRKRVPAPAVRGTDHACLFAVVNALHTDLPARRLGRRGESAEWSRARCLAALAHDVRGALANIAGLAEVLGDEPPEQSRQLASRIVTLAYDVSAMMSELIEAGRPERVDAEVHPTEVSARALLAECAADTEIQCRRKGLRFHAQLPDDAIVTIDRIKLARIIQNLLSNAVRYTGTGGVTLSASLTPTILRIVVQDTGIGIPATDLETVFRPYERLAAATAMEPDGAGLGLATVRRLCALLGAAIEAESIPGAGTTFIVTVPRVGTGPHAELMLDQPLPASA